MFEKLKMQDFQVHKDLGVELSPHVTTIVGPSDTGKSAVIRALRLLATNKPGGDAFIRHGAKNAIVTLVVDGRILERVKGTKNTYSVDEEELKAFGNDVPTEVAEILNLSDINFQGQHDGPFWFSETSGEVSRQLNNIVNLGVIDSTLANLDKAHRTIRSKIIVIQERVEQAKVRRKNLKFARAMDEQLTTVESLAEVATKASRDRTTVAELLDVVGHRREEVTRLGQALDSATRTITVGETWSRTHTHETELMLLLDKIEKLQEEASKPIPDLAPLLQLEEAARKTRQSRENLETQIEEIERRATILKEAEDLAKKAQENFEKEMEGQVCPLCGRSG